jgi:hypothetical protein
MKLLCHSQIALVVLLLFCWCAGSARANVYATDIRLNGSFKPAILLPGSNLTISYILNDTATGGVWVQIYSGTNVIETLASTNGDAGTNAGSNTAMWDDVTNLAEGVYSVSITAMSVGYDSWTNITDDGPDFSVDVPRGITVNRNTNSPFYGRVFVGNASTPFGIFKYNADGSPGDEGGFSSGGLSWGEGTEFPKFSPWKMAISGDDKVYIDDFAGSGVVYEFDQTIATNCCRAAVRPDNYPAEDPEPQLSGLAVTGAGTNTQIWMADENPDGSAGIILWQAATNGVAAADDPGMVVAPVDTNYLSQAPYDIALDTNNCIYAIQQITATDNPAFPLLCFPPFAGEEETNAIWAIGSEDPTLVYAYGVAVDPTTTNVAVAVLGSSGDPEYDTAGGLYLYLATNGQFVTDLDQTGGDPYYDVAWDNVGNLYGLDGNPSNGVWRVYSPPGTNQATTVAVPFIQAYNTLDQPFLCNPMADQNRLRFTLAGQSNVTYIIQRSCDLTNWNPMLTNYSTNATRCLCAPLCGEQDFYRAVASP